MINPPYKRICIWDSIKCKRTCSSLEIIWGPKFNSSILTPLLRKTSMLQPEGVKWIHILHSHLFHFETHGCGIRTEGWFLRWPNSSSESGSRNMDDIPSPVLMRVRFPPWEPQNFKFTSLHNLVYLLGAPWAKRKLPTILPNDWASTYLENYQTRTDTQNNPFHRYRARSWWEILCSDRFRTFPAVVEAQKLW